MPGRPAVAVWAEEARELVNRARSAAENAASAAARASRETWSTETAAIDGSVDAALRAKKAASDAEEAMRRLSSREDLEEIRSASKRARAATVEALDHARRVAPELQIAYEMAVDAADEEASREIAGTGITTKVSRFAHYALLILATLMMLSLAAWAATGNPVLLLIGAVSALLVIPVLGTMRDAESARRRGATGAVRGGAHGGRSSEVYRKIRMPAAGESRRAVKIRR